MNRGARKETIFLDDACALAFLRLVGELPDRFGTRVHGYALMPNHYHLMLESVRGNLSSAMQYLQSQYSGWLNRRLKRDGSPFKGRFRNRVVTSDPYWAHLLAYLHLNPVRARLASAADGARWTSHGAYRGTDRAPEWLTVDELLELHHGSKGYCQYIDDVACGRERGPSDFDAAKLWLATASVQAARPAALSLEAADALLEVAAVTKTTVEQLTAGRRGRGGQPSRWVAMWWLVERGGLPQSEVARQLRTSPATVTRALARVRAHRERPGDIARWTGLLCDLAGEGQ